MPDLDITAQSYGQLSYPEQIEVNNPALVRYTLSISGENPDPLPSANTPVAPVTDLDVAGLYAYVRVELEPTGATIIRPVRDALQRLSEHYNLWEWEITVSKKQTVTLRPHLYVEYHDNDNNIVPQVRDDRIMNAAVIPEDQVIYVDNTAPDAGAWFRSNLLGLIGILVGLPGTIIAWGNFLSHRHDKPTETNHAERPTWVVRRIRLRIKKKKLPPIWRDR